MHIPDGYLGPTTCGFFYVVMVPIWAFASRMVRNTLNAQQVPLLAIGAASAAAPVGLRVQVEGHAHLLRRTGHIALQLPAQAGGDAAQPRPGRISVQGIGRSFQ